MLNIFYKQQNPTRTSAKFIMLEHRVAELLSM